MPNVGPVNRLATRIGLSAARRFPDTVTFQRPTTTKDSVGGQTRSFTNTTPAGVPVRYRPASGSEVEKAGKIVSGNAYMLYVPAYFSSALIDVDAKSRAVVAARDNGQPSRTFQIVSVGRYEGLEIELMATLEE